jgi:hypothetical protein
MYGVRGGERERQEAIERARKVLRSAPRMLQALSVEDLAPPSEGERLKNITRTTRFQRDYGTRLEIVPANTGEVIIQVKCWNRDDGERDTLQMRATAEYAPVFRWLSECRAAFTAGELADAFSNVAFGQHRKILEALTRGKFLRLLWFQRVPHESLPD